MAVTLPFERQVLKVREYYSDRLWRLSALVDVSWRFCAPPRWSKIMLGGCSGRE